MRGNREEGDPSSAAAYALTEGIPLKMACIGYIFFSVISIIVIPLMFPELKWYYILLAYVLAPCLGFSNAYGACLTDMNMAYNYGKVALFVLASISGNSSSVVVGIVGCGLVKYIVSTSSYLMNDFKIGHPMLTSPRSMLLSQAIGTSIGCIVAPLTFVQFYMAFNVGDPEGEYKVPYVVIYRNIAILGVWGILGTSQPLLAALLRILCIRCGDELNQRRL